MIFWIFVILTIIGIALIVVTNIIGSSYKGKVREFFFCNDDVLIMTGATVALVSGFIAAIMLCIVLGAQIHADVSRASNEQRYNALMYKAQSESIRDEFGIINKEYIDEIQEWNEDLAGHQHRSDNFWIGVFYPKRAYEGLEIIDLKNIKMKN